MSDEQFNSLDDSDYKAIAAEMGEVVDDNDTAVAILELEDQHDIPAKVAGEIVDETHLEEIAKEIAEEMQAEKEAEGILEERKDKGRRPSLSRPFPSEEALKRGRENVQIFLSYAREDEERVEKLYQKLSKAGFKPWMDTKDLLPGERWEFCVQRAIQDSDFFLACLSANSVSKRGWVQREMKRALDLWQEKLDSDIYLIPARLEDCEVPESLRKLQWVDLFKENGWTRLVRAIRAGIERRL